MSPLVVNIHESRKCECVKTHYEVLQNNAARNTNTILCDDMDKPERNNDTLW